MRQLDAEKILLDLVANTDLGISSWSGKPFADFKTMPTTKKGDIGEDFLAKLLKDNHCEGVKVLKNRRGDYDVISNRNNEVATFEVKVATKDTNGSFQFNGIRYDRHYTHLFCLGVMPDSICFLILRKDQIGKPPHNMTSMAKGSNASFKLTKNRASLIPFDQFPNELGKVFNDG